MEVAQIRAEDGTFQKCTAESTEVETHLSIKWSKKDFGGILRPKFFKDNIDHGADLWVESK